MANEMRIAWYIVVCSYLLAASVVSADRGSRSACAGVANGRIIRSPKSCAHYYTCKNKAITNEGRCPENLLFDDTRQECNWAILVDCGSCLHHERSYLPHPVDCSLYIKCVKGVRRTYRCPKGKLFDEISSRCQRSDYVNCKNVDEEMIGNKKTTVKPPANNNEWPMPGGKQTRPPPTWGPPNVPGGGDGGGGPPTKKPQTEKPQTKPTRHTPKPGGIGIWRPPTNPNAKPNKPQTPTREPWGPPDAPVGIIPPPEGGIGGGIGGGGGAGGGIGFQ